jgi:hypothetical protein
MMIHIASAINLLALDNQEDGTMAGEGLSALQTFTYFVATPIALFAVIALLSYVSSGDRKKSKNSGSSITSID